MLQIIQSRLSPFRHRSFRSFFFVQAISLIGQMSSDLARAWIVVEMMGRAGSLGLLLMASAIPSLLLILQGGVVVDRVDVRRLMMITKTLLASIALVLAVVIEFGEIKMWMLLVYGLIEGCVVAFDTPAFQALTVRLVPREDFQQAIAINSTNFHAARMLGPIAAALLMAWHGPSVVFFFDALSYAGVVWVLRSLKIRQISLDNADRSHGFAPLIKGITYLFQNASLRYKWIQLMLTICLIFPIIIVVFRTYITQKFNLNADEFGYAFSFPALGSMLGALSFAVVKPERPIRALRVGIPCAFMSIVCVPFVPGIELAVFFMSLTGFFTYLSFASLTISMHLEVEEVFRGRVGSLIGIGFVSIGPLMSFPVGLFADSVGFERSVYILSSVFMCLSALLAYFHRRALKEWLKRAPRGDSQMDINPVGSA